MPRLGGAARSQGTPHVCSTSRWFLCVQQHVTSFNVAPQSLYLSETEPFATGLVRRWKTAPLAKKTPACSHPLWPHTMPQRLHGEESPR